MSKYSFFHKRGRPTLEEKEWLEKIESLSHLIDEEDADKYFENNPVCENADDLEKFYNYLNDSNTGSINQKTEINETQMKEEEQDIIDLEDGDDIPTNEPPKSKTKTPKNDVHDPFSEPVVEREYTTFGIGGDVDENYEIGGDDFVIDEPEIEEPAFAKSFSKGGSGHSTEPQPIVEDIPSSDFTDFEDFDTSSGGKGGNTEYKDLSPKQKRKMAEETAEAILKTYARFVPIPFKMLSKFNMRKLERMEMNNELNMKMVVQVGGVTVMDYVEEVNEQVDEIFTITEEMQEEIREPLVDVLLENEIALTPTQRLIIAVGGQLFQMGAMAWQYNKSNRQALDEFKKFHEDQKKQYYQGGSQMNTNMNYQNAVSMQEQQEILKRNQSQAQKSNDNIEFTPPPDLGDYINSTKPVEPDDDPNVEIEEVPNSGV